MRRAFANAAKAIAARPMQWLAITLAWPVLYYAGLLAALVLQFGDWPNYAKFYDWPANVARIFASTPSFFDATAIAREEWLFETGFLNTDYGLGISEWSLTLVPEKMLLILAMGAIMATIWVLNAARARSCGLGERGTATAATGLGAGLVALTGATMTWVVCCATPSWIVGLTMLGLSVATANWLEPLGTWMSIAGFLILGATAFVMAYRAGEIAASGSAPHMASYARRTADAR